MSSCLGTDPSERRTGKSEEGREAHPVTDEAHACAAEELDELGVELVVGVPRPARHLVRRLQVVEHVDLACRVLPLCRGLRVSGKDLLGHGKV